MVNTWEKTESVFRLILKLFITLYGSAYVVLSYLFLLHNYF